MNAYLLLANGMVFAGQSVGAEGVTVGEVVFATGMVGFQETLTPATTARSSPRPTPSSATTA